jgi:hypothetical protein
MRTRDLATSAFRFVLIIGVANLFAAMTYEGARGVTGPFLGSLGASATMVGFVARFGELVGYSLRSISGHERTFDREFAPTKPYDPRRSYRKVSFVP